MNKPVGIICAMELELQGLLEIIETENIVEKSGTTFYKGKIRNTDVVLVQCGIGKVSAAICTQMLIDFYSPAVIINSGVAGALSTDVTVGDVVIATAAVQHDFDCTAFGDPKGTLELLGKRIVELPADEEISAKLFEAAKTLEDTRAFRGIIATGDKFVADSEERLSIGKEFSALACEMEGGAMAQVCIRAGVPFAILRSISDDIGHNTTVDFNEFKIMAAKKTIDVLSAVLV
ncbi:MAG: 5'-methylthioadenosine/adenosylhomocysteine nucleosidase [Ruminococcaceae bacterium]|nr:5'-methylthioadenosine/adenosylhomocysteine nucleosidase [Oscillospiraceae bacterium]